MPESYGPPPGGEAAVDADVWRPDVPGHARAAYAVRHRDGTYTSTVAHDLGVSTRTARRWLKRAAALGMVDEYAGMPPAETYWGVANER